MRFASSSVILGAALSLVGCVEQSPDLPSEDDIKAAKEHLLSTPPTPKYPVNADLEGKVTYHMACHLRGLNLLTEPERLLRRVRGLTYVPLERADECCGFGGSFSVRYPGISGAMVSDKARFIEQTGVQVVVATDAGCLMNIAGCLHRRGSKMRALHLAEVLEKT